MLKNQPFHDVLFDRLLSKDIEKRGGIDFRASKHAFKRVAVIGMLFPTETRFKGCGFPMPDELRSDDKEMVHAPLRLFSEAGIPTSPNIQFDIYNYLPPIKSDFLMAACPLGKIKFPDVDLVIVNYVPAEEIGYTPLQRQHYAEEGFADVNNLDYEGLGHRKYRSVSRWNNMHDIWADAFLNVGAKFAVTFSDHIHDEINTRHLEYHEHVQVVLSSAEKCISAAGHSMGIVADSKTLDSYTPYLNKDSVIGSRIIKQRTLSIC